MLLQSGKGSDHGRVKQLRISMPRITECKKILGASLVKRRA